MQQVDMQNPEPHLAALHKAHSITNWAFVRALGYQMLTHKDSWLQSNAVHLLQQRPLHFPVVALLCNYPSRTDPSEHALVHAFPLLTHLIVSCCAEISCMHSCFRAWTQGPISSSCRSCSLLHHGVASSIHPACKQSHVSCTVKTAATDMLKLTGSAVCMFEDVQCATST